MQHYCETERHKKHKRLKFCFLSFIRTTENDQTVYSHNAQTWLQCCITASSTPSWLDNNAAWQWAKVETLDRTDTCTLRLTIFGIRRSQSRTGAVAQSQCQSKEETCVSTSYCLTMFPNVNHCSIVLGWLWVLSALQLEKRLLGGSGCQCWCWEQTYIMAQCLRVRWLPAPVVVM